jgi:hypothetical protein
LWPNFKSLGTSYPIGCILPFVTGQKGLFRDMQQNSTKYFESHVTEQLLMWPQMSREPLSALQRWVG